MKGRLLWRIAAQIFPYQGKVSVEVLPFASLCLLHHDHGYTTPSPPLTRKKENNNQPMAMAGEGAVLSMMHWQRSEGKDTKEPDFILLSLAGTISTYSP